MTNVEKKLEVGCEVLYINACIYKVSWMDENGDNLVIENDLERFSSVSNNEVEPI